MSQRSTSLVIVATAFVVGGALSLRAQSAPTAGQHYKDVQVLKDVSVDQFDTTMHYFTAALGWQCQNCHVRDQATGEINFAADHRFKTTAREMIELVKAVNDADYGAKINCATCHQGHNEPAGLQAAQPYTADQITAILARQNGPGPGAQGGAQGAGRPGGAPGQPPGSARAGGAPPQPPPPPPVEPIVAALMKGMGADAAAKITSRIITGTVINRLQQTMPFTIEEQGNKFHKVVTGPKGPVAIGFDGKNAWYQAEGKTDDAGGFFLQQQMRLNDLRRIADFSTRYTNLQAGRPTRLPARTTGGQPINVSLIQGDVTPFVQERLFVDAASGLLLRRQVISRAAANGTLVETIDYSDYKDVAGVQVPFTIKHTNWNTIDVYTVTDVKTGVGIPDANFGKPGR